MPLDFDIIPILQVVGLFVVAVLLRDLFKMIFVTGLFRRTFIRYGNSDLRQGHEPTLFKRRKN